MSLFPGQSEPSFCAQEIIGAASNVVSGTNSAYTQATFLAFYKQFTDKIPSVVLDTFVAVANATVLEARWHESWPLGMANYIAHLCTMFLQTSGACCPTTDGQVVAAGQTKGMQASASVGDVSVNYDTAALAEEMKGWGDLQLTAYGVQFQRMARLLGKAGMGIW